MRISDWSSDVCSSDLETGTWVEGVWKLGQGFSQHADGRFHVVAYDYGIKSNILRLLVERGCRITLVPAMTPTKDVLALAPDGVFLSNGPGDPAACGYAVETCQEVLDRHIPLLDRKSTSQNSSP